MLFGERCATSLEAVPPEVEEEGHSCWLPQTAVSPEAGKIGEALPEEMSHEVVPAPWAEAGVVLGLHAGLHKDSGVAAERDRLGWERETRSELPEV